MIDLSKKREIGKFLRCWWGRITSPYLRRQFLEAPHDGIFSKWIRDVMNLTRLSLPLPDLKPPFRKLGGLDKKD